MWPIFLSTFNWYIRAATYGEKDSRYYFFVSLLGNHVSYLPSYIHKVRSTPLRRLLPTLSVAFLKGNFAKEYRAASVLEKNRERVRKYTRSFYAPRGRKGREERARSDRALRSPWKRGESVALEKRTQLRGAGSPEKGKDDIIPLSQFAKQIYAWDGPTARGIYANV